LKHGDLLFPVRVIQHGLDVHPLPVRQELIANLRFEVNGKKYDLFDYLALNRVAGLLILKNGAVVREDYEFGAGPNTHWPSFSMAKSITSTLIGAALLDGKIPSLDDPVTK
jgi:Beta-lactamase